MGWSSSFQERYERLWPLVVDVIGRVDSARVWDNSHLAGPVEVALFADALPVGPCTSSTE